jgi:hypothetical protein
MRILMMAALLLAAMPVRAEWEKIFVTEFKMLGGKATAEFYLDVSTIQKQGDIARGWVMGNMIKQPTSSLDYKSDAGLLECDCKLGMCRKRNSVRYAGPMGTGVMVGKDSDPGEWYPAPPNTGEGKMRTAVCKRRFFGLTLPWD